jgi:hypothetical protein
LSLISVSSSIERLEQLLLSCSFFVRTSLRFLLATFLFSLNSGFPFLLSLKAVRKMDFDKNITLARSASCAARYSFLFSILSSRAVSSSSSFK